MDLDHHSFRLEQCGGPFVLYIGKECKGSIARRAPVRNL